MALEPTKWYFKVLNDELVDAIRYVRPHNYGPASAPPLGPEPDGSSWYQEWRDTPPDPGAYHDFVEGTPAIVGDRVETVDSYQKWDTETIRRFKMDAEVDQQVPNPSNLELLRDPTLERAVLRMDTERTAKRLEIQDAADPETVDSTLVPDPNATPEDDVRITLEIAELEPWPGAPDDTVGWKATLTLAQDADPATGVQARMILDVAPSDQGGVIGPFTQDSEDPYTWVLEARDGHKWQDPDLPVEASLYWDAHSLNTTDRLKVAGMFSRDSRLVNVAPPGAAGGAAQGTHWADTGQTVQYVGSNLVRLASTSGFAPGQKVRFNERPEEFIVDRVHSSIDLILTEQPPAEALGDRVYRWE